MQMSHPLEMVAVIALVSVTYKLTYKHTNVRSPCNMISSIVSCFTFVGMNRQIGIDRYKQIDEYR